MDSIFVIFLNVLYEEVDFGGVLKYFTKFTEHPCRNVLFLTNLQAWGLYEKSGSSVFFLIPRHFL